MTIHVALVADKRYLGPLIVAAASVVENTKSSKVHFHLFLEAVDSADRQETARAIRSVGACDVSLYTCDISRIKKLGMTAWRGTRGTSNVWVRTFFAELLPDVEWLVYLDCDILCLRDLTTFVSEAEKYVPAPAVLAVKDESDIMRRRETKWAEEVCGIAIDSERYFNARVLLLNLKKLRAVNFVNQVADFVARNGAPYAKDQTTLNVLLERDKALVSDVFNRSQDRLTTGIEDRPIIHFCSGVPWARSPFIPMSNRVKLWWDHYRRYLDISGSPILASMKLPMLIVLWKRFLFAVLKFRLLFIFVAPIVNIALKRKGYSLMPWMRIFWYENDLPSIGANA